MAKNLVDGTSTNIEENGNNISIQINFPIGYIYMSTSSTNPSTYFGGQWQRIAKGRTLVGVDENDTDFVSAELTGGSKELQSHNHKLTSANATSMAVFTNGGTGYDAGQTSGSRTYANVSFTTTNTGEGDSGNLQPYFTCYIWEKVGE